MIFPKVVLAITDDIEIRQVLHETIADNSF